MEHYLKPNLTFRLPGAEFYPFGETTLIRPMNIANIKQMSTAIYNNDIGLLERTVSNCVNFDIKELYISDWWFLLWWLRLNSYKNFPLQVTYVCPHCGEEHTYEIKIESLQYKEIPEGFDPAKSRVKLDSYENPVRIRPPKVGDEERVKKVLREKHVNLDTDWGQLTLDCMRDLSVLESEEKTLEDIYIAYRNNKFSVDDYNTITTYVDMVAYGVKDVFDIPCAGCKKEVPVAVEVRPLDFFPKDTTAPATRERILLC